MVYQRFFTIFILLGMSSSASGSSSQHDNKRALQRDPAPLDLCLYFDAFAHVVPGGTELCSCAGGRISCEDTRDCSATAQARSSAGGSGRKDQECIDYSNVTITLHTDDFGVVGDGRLFFTACSTSGGVYEETCVMYTTSQLNLELARVHECIDVTYGGDSCNSCEICNDGYGLDIDCTNLDPDATTRGCQEISLNDDLEELSPRFIGAPPEEEDSSNNNEEPTENETDNNTDGDNNNEDDSSSTTEPPVDTEDREASSGAISRVITTTTTTTIAASSLAIAMTIFF